MRIRFILISAFLFYYCLQALAEETLTWQDCVKQAAKNNPDLIAAVENINQQKSAKDITASTLYPQVTSSLNASTARTAGTDAKGKAISTTGDSYSYGVNGTQLIFDGFKTVNNVNAASETVKAAQEAYRFTSTQVRLELRNAFVNLLNAQEAVRVNEEIVKIRRSNLILITMRYQSGLVHKGALLTAEANLAQANFGLSQAKRDIELSQRQLMKAMGAKEFKPMSARGDFTVADSAKTKPDFEQIVKNNPSLLEAVAKKNSAAYGIKSAYGNFSPQLTGSAGANKAGSRWSPAGDEWNLGLGLTMPIFEGGLRMAELSQAKAAYYQAKETERSIKDAATVSLEQTWVSLQDAIETVGVQYKSLSATEERAKIADMEFSTGFMTYDNWTIIQDNLVSAKSSYLGSQTNALLAEASWIQAKGETLEYAN
ncbi:MAG: TolC family protein [Candidatus Omnitrophica bacterium]|nr:TolC family protein [Candidatus Omnitrophota bacterium]